MDLDEPRPTIHQRSFSVGPDRLQAQWTQEKPVKE